MTAQQKIVMSGMMAAVAVALVFSLGFIPGIGIIGAMAAGVFLLFVRDICGAFPAYSAYATAAIILFFLSSKKLPAVAFAALFGYYPILFADLARIKSVVLRFLIKLVLFEGVAIGGYFFAKTVLLLDFTMPAQISLPAETFIWIVFAVYQIAVLSYEGFIWVLYTKFNDKITERLRAMLRVRQ